MPKHSPNFWKKFPAFKLNPLGMYGEDLKEEGNDPPLAIEALGIPPNKRILLIGTSRLRALEMACRMHCKEVKILIIDNSIHAYDVWQNAKDQMIPERFDPDREQSVYLNALINQYGYQKVYNLVKHAKFIADDWANERLFTIIRERYAPHFDLTYVYPSNIVGFTWHPHGDNNPNKAIQVLNNIESLNPNIALHTNMPDPTTWIITKQHEHTPQHLLQLIGCSNELVVYNH